MYTDIYSSLNAFQTATPTFVHCAAVLLGRITGLARPSVRPVRAPNSKLKRRRKTITSENVSQDSSNRCVNSKDQKSGGRPHNVSALGRYSFLDDFLICLYRPTLLVHRQLTLTSHSGSVGDPCATDSVVSLCCYFSRAPCPVTTPNQSEFSPRQVSVMTSR